MKFSVGIKFMYPLSLMRLICLSAKIHYLSSSKYEIQLLPQILNTVVILWERWFDWNE